MGSALVRHPRVKRLSFVGSEPTGRAIQRSAAEVAVKSISLELGGKNPFIVFPDAPIDKVVEAAVLGMNFIWQGQSCSSTSRLLVHDSLYDEVTQRVAAKASEIRVGDPFERSTQMGAIISRAHLEKVEHYVALGKAEGARLLTGGRRPAGKPFERGFWYEPTVFADVTQAMRIAREEIFGPVLSILRWSDVDEVIAMANDVRPRPDRRHLDPRLGHRAAHRTPSAERLHLGQRRRHECCVRSRSAVSRTAASGVKGGSTSSTRTQKKSRSRSSFEGPAMLDRVPRTHRPWARSAHEPSCAAYRAFRKRDATARQATRRLPNEQ